MRHTYFVSLGSNYNAEQNIRVANLLLSKCFDCKRFSIVLKTRSIGMSFDCWFFNQMALIASSLSVEDFSAALKSIERQMGRVRNSRNVAIDLDLVEIDGTIVHKDFYKYPFLAQLRSQF